MRVAQIDIANELPDLPWSKLSGRCVLVTGAAGFLGSWITRTLVALHPLGLVDKPVQVIAMVRNTARARERLADVAGAVEFFEWDLNRIAVPDLAGVDYVIHAASQASPRFYGTDPIGTLPRHNRRVNVIHFDGHAEAIRNAQMGYALPRTSEGAIWARDHSAEDLPY